jgi:hypothetical protein
VGGITPKVIFQLTRYEADSPNRLSSEEYNIHASNDIVLLQAQQLQGSMTVDFLNVPQLMDRSSVAKGGQGSVGITLTSRESNGLARDQRCTESDTHRAVVRSLGHCYQLIKLNDRVNANDEN